MCVFKTLRAFNYQEILLKNKALFQEQQLSVQKAHQGYMMSSQYDSYRGIKNKIIQKNTLWLKLTV